MALPDFTMRGLLESGAHFGHQSHRWNPKMAPYIFGARNNIHIIDLAQTVPLMHQALKAVSDTVARGGRVLFVGTKRQAQDQIADAAKRSAQYYINSRWLGGMLTNWKTISGQRLEIERERREVLPADDRSASLRKCGREHVGDALAVRLVVVDDERAPQAARPRECGRGGALAIVGGANPKERRAVGVLRAEPHRARTFRQIDRRRGHRDQREPRRVRDRDLGLGDVRVHRSEHADDGIVGCERPEILRALGRIVLALHAIVEIVDGHARSAREAAPVRLVDREHDGVAYRNRARAVDPGERQVDAELYDERAVREHTAAARRYGECERERRKYSTHPVGRHAGAALRKAARPPRPTR